MKVYKYRSIRLTIIYIFTISAVAVFAFLPFAMGLKNVGSLRLAPVFVWIMLFLAPTIPLSLLVLMYLRARPLGISNERITTVIFGHRWKSIDWGRVTKIERFRVYDTFFYTYRYIFLVSADHARIRFDDWISDLPSLLADINANTAEYGIPVFAVDRGRDTLRKVLPSVTDTAERKKILHDGVRTSVTKL